MPGNFTSQAAKEEVMFQTVNHKILDRKDHIWLRKGDYFKCVSCGAVTTKPPDYPTDPSWMAGKYEKVTEQDRKACPYRK